MAEEKSPAEVLSDLVHVPFPNTAYLESMKRVIATQKLMLDGFQTNLDKWFERRREGAEATMTMLGEMHINGDHEKRAEAWQRWVSGAMARIMDDVQTQFEMMQKITTQLAANGEVKLPAELKKRPLRGAFRWKVQAVWAAHQVRLRARRDVAGERRERSGDGTAERRHHGNQGKAHGSGNETVFNGGCAGFVLEKLLHVETPTLTYCTNPLQICSIVLAVWWIWTQTTLEILTRPEKHPHH